MVDDPGKTSKRKRKSRRQLRLEAAAKRNVPDDVNPEDGFAVVSILADGGFINIDDNNIENDGGDDDDDDDDNDLVFDFKRFTTYQTDNNKNITSLCLAKHQHWHLSNDICRLRCLKHLYLAFCGQLPVKLHLPELEGLNFVCCTEGFYNNDKALNSLSTVSKTVQIFSIAHIGDIGLNHITSLIDYASNNFPKLKELSLSQKRETGDLVFRYILEQLRRNGPILGEKLNVLCINASKLTEDHTASILCNVVANYKHLRALHFRGNQIESLQGFAERIDHLPHDSMLAKTIEYINLCGNPVIEKLKKKDVDEIAALLIILSRLQRLQFIKGTIDGPDNLSIQSYCPDVEYALRVNAAGRILLEGNNNALPISVWPIVLERAYKTSSPGSVKDQRGKIVHRYQFDATGLHYLIRNGPIINAIAISQQERNNCKETSR